MFDFSPVFQDQFQVRFRSTISSSCLFQIDFIFMFVSDRRFHLHVLQNRFPDLQLPLVSSSFSFQIGLEASMAGGRVGRCWKTLCNNPNFQGLSSIRYLFHNCVFIICLHCNCARLLYV
ncbi:hypothetical protein Hanom_Chr03g00277451 [Helianthus anomalus]